MSRQQRLYDALSAHFKPDFLTVEDESHTHQRQGHETHFKILVVSDNFSKLSLIERHRLVYELTTSEFKTGLHALSLHLYTPDEWEKRKATPPQTPSCQHRKS